MAWMSAAMPYITMGMSAASTIAQGNVQEQMAAMEAKQLREQGLADQAEAQQVAQQERKRADLLQSRATALAAKSGTGVDDPNVLNTIADIDAQGEYNALSALYSGNTSARSKRYAASVAKQRGKNAKQGSLWQAGSTVVDSANTNGWFA